MRHKTDHYKYLYRFAFKSNKILKKRLKRNFGIVTTYDLVVNLILIYHIRLFIF